MMRTNFLASLDTLQHIVKAEGPVVKATENISPIHPAIEITRDFVLWDATKEAIGRTSSSQDLPSQGWR